MLEARFSILNFPVVGSADTGRIERGREYTSKKSLMVEKGEWGDIYSLGEQ